MHYLYLYCTNTEYQPDNISSFIKQCQDYQLLSDRISPSTDHRYLLDDRFTSHVCFLGCSPYLKLLPDNDTDTDYCSALVIHNKKPSFDCSDTLTTVVCPGCSEKMDIVSADVVSSLHIACPHCMTESHVADFNWRKDGGYYNFAIKISNIFPKEAVPDEALMIWLKQKTGSSWKYFYV